jgi:hypothetical protein
MKSKPVSQYKVSYTKPVAPAAKTVVSQTPTRSPGVSPTRTYDVGVPVPGSTRIVNQGRKD